MRLAPQLVQKPRRLQLNGVPITIRNDMDTSPPLAAEQLVRCLCSRMVVQSTVQESEEEPMNKITRAGVEFAKSVFNVCATDRHGNKL